MMFFRFLALLIGGASSAAAFSPVAFHQRQHLHNVDFPCRSLAVSTTTTTRCNMISLGDSNFQEVLNSEKAILVDACAPWCGPCKLIEPVLGRAAEKWSDQLEMAKYNVESDHPELKMEMLLQKSLPRALPSLVLFQKGKAIAKRDGIITDDELDAFLSMHLRVKTPKKKNGAGLVSFATAQQSDDYMLSSI